MTHSGRVLNLAPRSVRDLIYSGRLPSVRLGRLHYVRATDLELERRRRLGLRLPSRRPRPPRLRIAETVTRPRVERKPVDPARRQQRAAERAALVDQWAARHHFAAPEVPFTTSLASDPTQCAICGRKIRQGGQLVVASRDDADLCVTCGRRVLLDWADHRRLEAATARRMAQDLGSTAARVA